MLIFFKVNMWCILLPGVTEVLRSFCTVTAGGKKTVLFWSLKKDLNAVK